MIDTGHRDFAATLPHGSRYFLGVSGYDHAISRRGIDHTLPDADNEGRATQQTEGFSGEPRCTEPGGNNRERARTTCIGAVLGCKRHAIQGIPLVVEIQADEFAGFEA